MASDEHNLLLSSGYKMPRFGLGTWLSDKGEVAEAVRVCLDVGYRHVDCAHVYGNQDEIGEVFEEFFRNKKLKREELFVTSKVWDTYHSYAKAREEVDIILKQLRLDYLDLLLIHWPMGLDETKGEMFPKDADGNFLFSDIDYLDTWKAMEEAVDAGKVRSIGLSNFNSKQVQRILDVCRIKPAVLQVEINPYLPQEKLVNWCRERNIAVTAYTSLGNMGHIFRTKEHPNLLTENVVLDIAKTHGKTAAQVLLRWAIQRDIIVIPKSTKKPRIEENFKLFDFKLTSEEMKKINGLDRGLRLAALDQYKTHPHYPFHEEF